MTVAYWITAIAALITALVSVVALIGHRRHDEKRFADIHQRINGNQVDT